MNTYAWRDGFKPPVEAEVFGAVVERIQAEKGRYPGPQDIVEAARQQGSPIKAALQWDDAKAAESYRVDQARKLLNSLQVVVVRLATGQEVASKALFRVKAPEGGPGGYAPRGEIVGDRELRAQVVAGARRELEAFVRKYSDVLALGPFIPRLQDVIDGMLDEIHQLEADAARRRERPAQRDSAERRVGA